MKPPQPTPLDPRPAEIDLDRATQAQLDAFAGDQPTLGAGLPSGEMITLRPAREADIPDIVAACQDPESVRWTTVPEPYTLGDATGFVNDYVPQRWLLGRGAIFVVAGPDDRYAGSMDLRLLAPTIGDVGYLVAPWARGHGYASAALRTLCEWGFRDLGLHRVEWRAYLGNHASRAVAEKAGFTVEGVGRAVCVQRGEYRDAWLGARLRTDPEPKELT